jgi:hypothetical protein
MLVMVFSAWTLAAVGRSAQQVCVCVLLVTYYLVGYYLYMVLGLHI